jgi:hypothetical protein
LRTIASVASLVVTLLVALYGSGRILFVREAGRATVLIQELRGVGLGQSEESVLPLIRRFSGFHPEYDRTVTLSESIQCIFTVQSQDGRGWIARLIG